MKILNPKTVIADLLETAFNLKTYVEIIGEVAPEDFSISDTVGLQRVNFEGKEEYHYKRMDGV